MEPKNTNSSPEEQPARKPWVKPVLQALPKLTDLTLVSGGVIGGGGDSGGGGIF